MRRQQEAVTGKRFHHQILMREESDFDEVLKINASFELPADDELVCTSDEVREEFAILDGAHESLLD